VAGFGAAGRQGPGGGDKEEGGQAHKHVEAAAAAAAAGGRTATGAAALAEAPPSPSPSRAAPVAAAETGSTASTDTVDEALRLLCCCPGGSYFAHFLLQALAERLLKAAAAPDADSQRGGSREGDKLEGPEARRAQVINPSLLCIEDAVRDLTNER